MDFLPVSKPLQPASRFNEWLYEAICPWLKGRVLEVNSGPDTISSIFLQRERKVHLTARIAKFAITSVANTRVKTLSDQSLNWIFVVPTSRKPIRKNTASLTRSCS